ncbi:non-ribosomal peptide synthetase [Chitinophaga varians]|uniref:non-ribosomal peptide synthetase n=1 Tax=Chitinophaga varians TaxID=2202339 RepID=UPI00165F6F19|nr:non-ribosomal peptide synthetase [Chitinophaga varians]MBC9914888.1 amino acid adenylation domain-containing protein [Chitinophaga varians]
MSIQSKINLTALNANMDIASREYWKNRLAGFGFNSYFNRDIDTHTAFDVRNENTITQQAPAALWKDVAAIAPQGKPLHIVLLTALGAFTQKCSSLPDTGIFTPLYQEGPTVPGTDNLTLVRVKDTAGKSFAALLPEMKDHILQDMKYGNYPIDKILETVTDSRNDIPVTGMLLTTLQKETDFSLPADLLFVFSAGEALDLTIKYNADSYSAAYITRIAQLFFGFLEAVVGRREQPLSSVNLITAAEKEQVLGRFNDTRREFPADMTVMDFFHRQLEKSPDSPAIKFNGQQLSYRGLDDWSSRIAGFLAEQHMAPGTVIGVSLERSPELMAAIWGILKAGCVYLPMTADYPVERIRYVLKNSQAAMLITHTANREELKHDIRCVAVAEMEGTALKASLATPEGIAYILYTSGSTGTPKGVMIKHRSLVNRLNWMQREYNIGAQDIILQKTPLVFDVSVWELFLWCFNGSRLVLAMPGIEKDPAGIARTVEQEGITVMHFVPAMLNEFLYYLLENRSKHSLTTIRHLFASGEELKTDHARQFFRYFPDASLHNLYGPTEATIDVAFHEVDRMLPYHKIPIGKPIDNTSLLIFSREGALQPVGIPGELYIGGENLSPGYVNREELTKERFVNSPLNASEVLYKTGDIACWQPDGNIVFLGRADDQVKINGHRIEPGEVEQVIKSSGMVKDAVVLTKQLHATVKLVAYLVVPDGFSEDALRKFLQTAMPPYMVPGYFVKVPFIPVNVSGKTDRKELLAIEIANNTPYVAPVSDIEKDLASQWENILGKERIGTADNFFRMGGDSILALRLVGRMNNELQRTISIADLYANPTIGELAAFIEQSDSRQTPGEQEAIYLQLDEFQRAYLEKYPNDTIEKVYPMSDIEKAMCFIQLARPEDILNYEQHLQPVYYEEFHPDKLREAIDILLKRHEILRTGFDLHTFAHVIHKTISYDIPFYDISLLEKTAQQQRLFADLEKNRLTHFDFTRPPLWKISVYKLRPGYHEILFECHHAIFDGWSLASFITELNNVYGDCLRNDRVELPSLEASFRDHIAAQLFYKSDAHTIAFWKNELRDFRPLTLNRESGPRSFHSYRYTYPRQLRTDLERVANEQKTTIKHILFSAYVYALSVLSGESDVLAGLVTFTRPLKKDGDKLLGCFLNTIPFRVDIPGDITWAEYLQMIDAKIFKLKAYEHLSLSDIKQAANASTIENNPFFSTLFNFVNWHINDEMRLEKLSAPEENRIDFDTFLRGYTFLDISFNVDKERIYCMHEYASPYITTALFNEYVRIFDMVLDRLITTPDERVDLQETYWKQQIGDSLQSLEVLPADITDKHILPPAGPKENMPLIVELDGQVDVTLLEKSVAMVLQQHELLANKFSLETKVSVKGTADWETCIASLVNTAFDAPSTVVRGMLLVFPPNRHKLVLVFHPAVADRYAVNYLLQEILLTYQQGAAVQREKKDAPVWGGYLSWRKKIQKQLHNKCIAYWRKALPGNTPPLELDITQPSGADGVYESAVVDVQIPAPLAIKIADFAAATEVPEKVVLMAAFNIVLSRYSRQENVVIGTAENNRDHEWLKSAVGPISNVLALHSVVRPDMSFRNYCHQLNAIYQEALQYRHIPFHEIMEILGRENNGDVVLPFRIVFDYNPVALTLPEIDGIVTSAAMVNKGSSEWDIQVVLQREGQGIGGMLTFNRRRFRDSDMALLTAHWTALMEALQENPDNGVATFELLSAEERAGLLRELDKRNVSFPADMTIADLFDIQVRRAPRSIAVTMGPENVTYGELSEKSAKVALMLRKNGVKRGDVVGLLMDRSVDLIIAIFGILRSGAAYLPIDVDYPEERIMFLARDSKAKLVLAGAPLPDRLSFDVPVLQIGDAWLSNSGESELVCVNQPADLCYVIYTSGSTGTPKGVMITHRNVVRLLFNDAFQFDFGPDDVWPMFHSHCFDVSVWEIFGSLLSGGRLVIIPKMIARDPKQFYTLLQNEKVTVLNQTPSAFYSLMPQAVSGQGARLHLRYVIFAGEKLNPVKLKPWYAQYPDVRLINMYGITEITVHATYKEIGHEEIEHNISNVGKPLPTLSVYVLDEHRKMVPKGVAGEIYVGGEGVALCYLGNPTLTDKRFLDDPYQPGSRIYRSGDLARITDTGEIEYIQRIDNQIKLRGFRVEPGEIEAGLGKHPLVKEAVVVLKGNDPNKYLVAYVIPEGTVDASSLKQFLSTSVPDYMVPSHYVLLQEFPLTSNGKLDTRALPDPEIKAGSDYKAAFGPVESVLVEIYADTLQLDPATISVNANMFELGVHSLLMPILVSDIHQKAGIDLPIRALFRYPTIATLAAYIETIPKQ